MIQLSRLFDVIRSPQADAQGTRTPPSTSTPAMSRDQFATAGPRVDPSLKNAVQNVSSRVRAESQALEALARRIAGLPDNEEKQRAQLEFAFRQRTLIASQALRDQLGQLAMRTDLTPDQVAQIGILAQRATVTRDVGELTRMGLQLRQIAAGRQADQRLLNAASMIDSRLYSVQSRARDIANDAQPASGMRQEQLKVALAETVAEMQALVDFRDTVSRIATGGGLDENQSQKIAEMVEMAIRNGDASGFPQVATRIRLVAVGESLNSPLAQSTERVNDSVQLLRQRALLVASRATQTNNPEELQGLQIKLADIQRGMDVLMGIRSTLAILSLTSNVPESRVKTIAELADQAVNTRDVGEQIRISNALKMLAPQE